MSYIDFLLGPVYFFIVIIFANLLKDRLAKTEEEKKIYTRALIIKLISVTFFALIYQFYYGGGDTMGFYKWSEKFVSFLLQDTSRALEFLFTDSEEAFYIFKYNYRARGYDYILKYGSREASFIKITSVINLLAFNSYISTSYIFAFISFIGNWLMYKLFIHYYPLIKNQLAWATLYIPSVAFWGSGILKDTLSFAAIGFLVYYVFKIFILKKNIIKSVFFMFLAVYFMLLLKAYVFLAFLPAGVIWVFNERKDKIKSQAVKAILTPFFIVMMIATLAGLMVVAGEQAGKFSLSSIEQTTKDFQGWHKVASEDGSGYVIHNADLSPTSVIFAIPESINVTYFRPYLWEANGIVVFLGAIESLIIFLFFLKIFLYKGKIFSFFRAIFSKPIIQMCLIYALFFGFVVGFTSFNFGALARYKIPSMPFFVASLVMISHQIDILSGKIKKR